MLDIIYSLIITMLSANWIFLISPCIIVILLMKFISPFILKFIVAYISMVLGYPISFSGLQAIAIIYLAS